MKLSVIISNRNDTTMLAVTVRSCIEELRSLGLPNCEIVIADNSDQAIYDRLGSYLPSGYLRDRTLKVYHQDFPCLFTARELAAEKSTGEYIACVDSHMLIGRSMFVDLVNFMDRHKDDKTLGFAHAPISWAHQHEMHSKHDRDMSVNELGNWNRSYDHERTITWKGMPWICRRDFFLDKVNGLGAYGALSQHKLSWGGGDLHIGVKPWLLGFKNWAVPTSAGIHIGPFPNGNKNADKHSTPVGKDKYRLYGNSGIGPHSIGFLVACYVLGGIDMMNRNKKAIRERFGKFIDVDKEWDKAIEYGEDEKAWLDSKRIYSFNDLLKVQPWNHAN